jgi:hypothetical protein
LAERLRRENVCRRSNRINSSPFKLGKTSLPDETTALGSDEGNEMSESLIEDTEDAPPITSEPDVNVNEFELLLTGYGRSVIRSAMDHTPDEADTLKESIVDAKTNIVAKHNAVQDDLEVAKGEIIILGARNSKINADRVVYHGRLVAYREANKDLEKQLDTLSQEKKISVESLEKETTRRKELEAELSAFKLDKKRKRESVAAIWEEVENVKLD